MWYRSPEIVIEQIPQPVDNQFIPKIFTHDVKVIMKTHAAFVYSAILFAVAGAQAGATKTGSSLVPATLTPNPEVEVSRPGPAALVALDTPAARHLFPVSDEKGLLLSCIAPEMDSNSETDVFKNCTLAPGRTLDDVMHSFVRGIHEEQRQHLGDRADPNEQTELKGDRNSARK